jgi:hypothetical protein
MHTFSRFSARGSAHDACNTIRVVLGANRFRDRAPEKRDAPQSASVAPPRVTDTSPIALGRTSIHPNRASDVKLGGASCAGVTHPLNLDSRKESRCFFARS